MNNIKEKISAMYDGELDSSEIDELIEIVNSNKEMQKLKNAKKEKATAKTCKKELQTLRNATKKRKS